MIDHQPNALSFPESEEIVSLLSDLTPGGAPESVRGRADRNGNDHRRPVVLGAFSLGEFLHGTNWLNEPGFVSPLSPPPVAAPASSAGSTGRILGALTLREFLAGVNWQNAAAGPRLQLFTGDDANPDDSRLVLDFFMQQVEWD